MAYGFCRKAAALEEALGQEAPVWLWFMSPKGPRTRRIGDPFKGVTGGYIGTYGDYTRAQRPPKIGLEGRNTIDINGIWCLKSWYLGP